jgi:hypothetical protein
LFCQSARMLSRLAEILGDNQDAVYYAGIADRIRQL